LDKLLAVQIMVFVVSLAMTFGLWIQWYKIFHTRSAKDFSIALVVTVLLNEIAWLIYGFTLMEWPIIAIDTLNLPAAIGICVGFFKYRDSSTTIDSKS